VGSEIRQKKAWSSPGLSARDLRFKRANLSSRYRWRRPVTKSRHLCPAASIPLLLREILSLKKANFWHYFSCRVKNPQRNEKKALTEAAILLTLKKHQNLLAKDEGS